MSAIDWVNPITSHPLNRGLVGWWLASPTKPDWSTLRLLDLDEFGKDSPAAAVAQDLVHIIEVARVHSAVHRRNQNLSQDEAPIVEPVPDVVEQLSVHLDDRLGLPNVLGDLSDRSLRHQAAFNKPGEAEALAEFLVTAEKVGKSLRPGFAQTLVAWSTNGFILYGLIGGTGEVFTKGSGATLGQVAGLSLGLNASARLLTSERGIRLLTQGLKSRPGSEQAKRIAAQIVTFAFAEGFQDEKEKPKETIRPIPLNIP